MSILMKTAQTFVLLDLEARTERELSGINALNLPSILADAKKQLIRMGYSVLETGSSSFGLPLSILLVGDSSEERKLNPEDDFFKYVGQLTLVYRADRAYSGTN